MILNREDLSYHEQQTQLSFTQSALPEQVALFGCSSVLCRVKKDFIVSRSISSYFDLDNTRFGLDTLASGYRHHSSRGQFS